MLALTIAEIFRWSLVLLFMGAMGTVILVGVVMIARLPSRKQVLALIRQNEAVVTLARQQGDAIQWLLDRAMRHIDDQAETTRKVVVEQAGEVKEAVGKMANGGHGA